MQQAVIKYRQHVPGFVDTGYDPESGEVATVADLLALPFVADKLTLPNFYRFSVARGRHPSLMAEYDGGRIFWVVAHVDDGDTSELPDWTVPYHLR